MNNNHKSRLNRGGSYGLEIPVIHHFQGQEQLVNWAVKKLETVKMRTRLSSVKVFEINI